MTNQLMLILISYVVGLSIGPLFAFLLLNYCDRRKK